VEKIVMFVQELILSAGKEANQSQQKIKKTTTTTTAYTPAERDKKSVSFLLPRSWSRS